MLIPLIPFDPTHTDFNCRDGEFMEHRLPSRLSMEPRLPSRANTIVPRLPSRANTIVPRLPTQPSIQLLPQTTPPGATIRIPLQSGEKQKAELLLSGEISRVDPATADRLTQAIVQKAAEALLDISTDLRRQGLFILPFRFYTMAQLSDGSLSRPTPQGVALPTDYPPHPEITAASATDDALTLAIRFPVTPHRLTVDDTDCLSSGESIRTFISYPLYIPDPKEMRGSIGSVSSLAGGTATGIRFAFLSASAIKASVAAPEKYYELVGNERTGYRFSSKATTAPDYSCYYKSYGYVPPFPRESLLALGERVDADTDPRDWIADWYKKDEGYLPASLPYIYVSGDSSEADVASWPQGIDWDSILATAQQLGLSWLRLTRPMAFASDAVSRRNATPRAIRTLRILGLPPETPAFAILYGSDDGIRWTPLRRFDPRRRALLLTPPRLLWRLLYASPASHPAPTPAA